MNSLLQGIVDRQRHLAYFVIPLFFIPLCMVIGHRTGPVFAMCAFVVLVCALECLYRLVMALQDRSSDAWWARNRRSQIFGIRLLVLSAVLLVELFVTSSLARWGLLVIVILAIGFAVAFRLFRKEGEL